MKTVVIWVMNLKVIIIFFFIIFYFSKLFYSESVLLLESLKISFIKWMRVVFKKYKIQWKYRGAKSISDWGGRIRKALGPMSFTMIKNFPSWKWMKFYWVERCIIFIQLFFYDIWLLSYSFCLWTIYSC